MALSVKPFASPLRAARFNSRAGRVPRNSAGDFNGYFLDFLCLGTDPLLLVPVMSLAICAWCLRPVEPATEWVILPTTHKGVIRLCETCQAEPDQARIAAALGYTPEDLDLAQRMAQAEPVRTIS